MEKVDISKIEGVIISHAHFDHYGALPSLMKMGYDGSVFTGRLTSRIFYSWVKRKIGLFAGDFGDWLRNHLDPVNYFDEISLNNYSIELLPSYHSFDSSMTLISNAHKTILYTGDLGINDEAIQVNSEIDAVLFDGTNLFLEAIDDPNVLLTGFIKIINSILVSGLNVVIPVFTVPSLQLIEAIHYWLVSGLIPAKPNFYIDSKIELTQFLHEFYFDKKLILSNQEDLIEPYIFLKHINSRKSPNSIEIQPFLSKKDLHVQELISIYGSLEEVPWNRYVSTSLYYPLSNHFPRNRLPTFFKKLNAKMAIPIGDNYGREQNLLQWWRENIPNTHLQFFPLPERKISV